MIDAISGYTLFSINCSDPNVIDFMIVVTPLNMFGVILDSLPGNDFRLLYKEIEIFVFKLHRHSNNFFTAALMTAIFCLMTAVSEQVMLIFFEI